jgi:hypothetical protein
LTSVPPADRPLAPPRNASRTHLPAGVKTPWDVRVEQRKKAEATKLLERELKAEKEQEAERSVPPPLPSCVVRRRYAARVLHCQGWPHSLSIFRTLCSKKQAHKERKERVEEKKRLEEMAAKMSAKKLQRMKKVRRLALDPLTPS